MTIAQHYENKGIEKGIEKVAKEILNAGQSVDFVSQITGLSKTKIQSLNQPSK